MILIHTLQLISQVATQRDKTLIHIDKEGSANKNITIGSNFLNYIVLSSWSLILQLSGN